MEEDALELERFEAFTLELRALLVRAGYTLTADVVVVSEGGVEGTVTH